MSYGEMLGLPSQRLRDISANIEMGIFRSTADAEGRFLVVNHAMERILGYRRDELLTMKIVSLYVNPEERALVLREAASKPRGTQRDIYLRKKNGTRIIARITMIGVQDKDGNFVHFDGTLQDVTRHVRATMKLRATQEFNGVLLQYCPHPVWVINPDKTIEYVNPAFQKLTGFLATELLRTPPPYPWWIASDFARSLEAFELAFANEAHGLEQKFWTKEHQTFWVRIDSRRVERRGKLKYYVSHWTDISREKGLIENSQFYISEITKAQEQERKRVACEIHDGIVQDLASISMEIQDIVGTLELHETVKQRLIECGETAAKALEGARTFAYELRPSDVERYGFVQSVERLIADQNDDIIYKLRVMGDEPSLSPDVRIMLYRIVQEAFRNIRKHSHATVAKITVSFRKRAASVTVVDNGIGFTRPRTLGDLARARKLGLIGANERTRLLGGEFRLESGIGKGTRLSVKIPL